MNTTIISMHVNGMTCEHCEQRVISLLEKLPGVALVTASAMDRTVTVSGEGIDKHTLAACIEAMGFAIARC